MLNSIPVTFVEIKPYSYKGQIITASSKEEAIQKIVADSKTNIDMKVVNKWMKKNLDVTDEGLGKDHWKIDGEVYYTWDAAKRLAKKVGGYHIPTAEEWNELAEACGGTYYESDSGNNINYKEYENIQGLVNKLKIKLVGSYLPEDDDVIKKGKQIDFWSSESSKTKAYQKSFYSGDDVMYSTKTLKKYGNSVRLVKD